MNNKITDTHYAALLNDLKDKVSSSRYKAALSVNRELILLYHHIGSEILKSQATHGWGAKIIDQLSNDLHAAFPEMKGFSTRNLKYMRKFAEQYPNIEFVQEALAQLTWYHNITLLDKVPDKQTRLFYVKQAINNGWSRNIMVTQIETALHKRQGMAITNFHDKLPSPQSDLAHYTLKDPYIFDFMSLSVPYSERELELELVKHVEKFLLELGAGFAFVGRQFKLEISDKEFYIDLLFYHLKMRCFVVIELKKGDFIPEYAGKMNFYCSAVDNILKHTTDQPTIGLILCQGKDKLFAEYALKDIHKPIGISEYELTKSLPKNFKGSLPSIEEIEKEFSKEKSEKKYDSKNKDINI